MGIFNVSQCVCVRGRTHTCFVREQTALCTLCHGLGNGSAECTTDESLGCERILEDHAEGGGNALDVDTENEQTADDVDQRHDGNDLFCDRTEALNTAEENEAGKCGNDHTDDNCNQVEFKRADGEGRIDTEGAEHPCEVFCDRVGLNHSTDKAERDDSSHREECGKELTELTLESGLDVVNRTTLDRAVRIGDTGLLCENGLCIDGSHAEEGDDPHPEDGAGATDQNGAAGTDDVTGTDLCGNRGSKCLEGRKTALLLATLELDVAKYVLHALAEAANLNEARADRVEQTDADEQEEKNVAGKIRVDRRNDIE